MLNSSNSHEDEQGRTPVDWRKLIIRCVACACCAFCFVQAVNWVMTSFSNRRQVADVREADSRNPPIASERQAEDRRNASATSPPSDQAAPKSPAPDHTPPVVEKASPAPGPGESASAASVQPPDEPGTHKTAESAELRKLTNSIGMELILIPAGKFRMGSPASELERHTNEAQVDVTLTKSFYLGKTEVTQGQWQAVMGTTPWRGEQNVMEGDTFAATHVNWNDAQAFCKKLSENENVTYRLPTEAEWEYACRAGTTTRFSFGDDESSLSDYAWWGGIVDGDGNTKLEPYAHEVGRKRPNPFGLYDMHGNTWEWCEDAYTGKHPGGIDPLVSTGDSDRAVIKGGSWDLGVADCRSATRSNYSHDDGSYFMGFRVVRSFGQSSDESESAVPAKPKSQEPMPSKPKNATHPAAKHAPQGARHESKRAAQIHEHAGCGVAEQHETLTLAHGAKIQVEKWGETFLGYDYQPPIALGDRRLREIVYNTPCRSIQVDSKHRRIYWCGRDHIFRANLDGDGVEMLADNRPQPRSLVLDVERGKLYWVEGAEQSRGTLMSADLNGRNEKSLAERLKHPWGLAIDTIRDELYYSEEYRIVRVKTDGSGETLIVGEKAGPSVTEMAFDPSEGRLYWLVAGGGHVRHVNRDGSAPTDMHVAPMGGANGFALDTENRKIYFVNSHYRRVERANFDGCQQEVLAVFPDVDSRGFTMGFVSGAIAADTVHKRVYFAVTIYDHVLKSPAPRIFHMGLPPVLTPKTRPAPPLITEAPAGEHRAGVDVALTGRHFENTLAVSFIDDATCRHMAAKFQVVDDQALTVTVPRLSKECTHPVIVVQTPSGVTMTLRKDLKVVSPEERYEHERLSAGPLAQLWLCPDAWASQIETAIAYLEEDSHFAAEGKGIDTIFAKNGSLIRLSFLADSVIYHEPFAIMTDRPEMSQRSKTEAGLKFVPVPAIRPSFLDALFTYGQSQ